MASRPARIADVAARSRRLARPLTRAGVLGPIIYTYHRFCHSPADASSAQAHTVSLRALERQLKRLSKLRTVVGLAEFLAAPAAQRRGLALVMIDDGHRSIQDAMPVFAAAGVRPAIALVPSLVDGGVFWRDRVMQLVELGLDRDFARHAGLATGASLYEVTKTRQADSQQVADALVSFAVERGTSPPQVRYLNRDEVTALADGVDFVSHTQHHYMLSTVGDAVVRAEIEDSLAWLGAHASASARLDVLVPPFGGSHTYDARTVREARRLGVSYLFGNGGRIAMLEQAREALTLFVRHSPKERDA